MTMHRFFLPLLLLFVTLFPACDVNASSPRRQAKPVVSILGDSYSTFEGHIPAGYDCWYNTNPDPKRTDVDNVRQTWWWQVIDRGGYILGCNNSWSGSTISYTGYRGDDYSDRSFITRLDKLGSPDILLIFGATNDCWAKVPLGEYTYSGLTRGHYSELRPALGILLREATERFPGTDIYFIANSDLTESVNDAIRTVCDHYSVPVIWLHDIDKKASHPSRTGMTAIADQVLQVLNK